MSEQQLSRKPPRSRIAHAARRVRTLLIALIPKIRKQSAIASSTYSTPLANSIYMSCSITQTSPTTVTERSPFTTRVCEVMPGLSEWRLIPSDTGTCNLHTGTELRRLNSIKCMSCDTLMSSLRSPCQLLPIRSGRRTRRTTAKPATGNYQSQQASMCSARRSGSAYRARDRRGEARRGEAGKREDDQSREACGLERE
ncbi:hypothetical protein BV20DRAFT_966216 [Pilatotrama ljubarskyi]|nr:hypothetical protein BV20DRAFT_966216 [Pilatotrama ljubarskyi]